MLIISSIRSFIGVCPYFGLLHVRRFFVGKWVAASLHFGVARYGQSCELGLVVQYRHLRLLRLTVPGGEGGRKAVYGEFYAITIEGVISTLHMFFSSPVIPVASYRFGSWP